MSYTCQCANGKTWGAANSGCNDNASNCAQCCSGEYGGVAGSYALPTAPKGGKYIGEIKFPEVTDADKYDIYLTAEENTEHADYSEARFADDTIDINSSTGSKSFLMQKVMYQTLPVTITLSCYSGEGAITSLVAVTDTITTSRGKNIALPIPFEIKATLTSNALTIDRQPSTSDVMAFVERTIGAAPVNIPGEDIYPAISDTDTVDGATTTATKIVMDNNVADNLVVGDKITIATTDLTDTVDGAVTSGVKVVMDNNVATKMAVGDRVTGSLSGVTYAALDASIITVAALDPDGDNAKEFSLSEAVALGDEAILTFTPKCNRELFTVAVLNPDTDNVKEFSYVDEDGGTSSRFGVRDGATLSFSNQRNYRWPIDNIDMLADGMNVKSDTANGFTGNAKIKEYLDETTIFEGEVEEYKVEMEKVKSLDTLSVKPTLTRNSTSNVLSTVQTGNIIFDQQALLTMADETLKIFSYNTDEIERLYDYNVEFSDLKAEINTVTTTTTASTVGSASTTMAVSSVLGIADETVQTVDGATTSSVYVVLDSVAGLNVGQTIYGVSSGTLTGNPTIVGIQENTKTINISSKQTFADGITLTFANSIVSGPGIDPAVIEPYVTNISSLNLTLSVAQALENGQTFTFSGAGDIVTITGNIKVNNVGNEDITLRFDVDNFLTKHS